MANTSLQATGRTTVDAASTVELSVRGLRLFGSSPATLEFDLYAGEVLVVLGRNGTGKSLLVNLLSGIFPVGRGTVRYGDLDLGVPAGLIRARQHRFGVVFQEPALLRSLTIFENLLLPLQLSLQAAGAGPWARWTARASLREEVAHLLALVGAPGRCQDLFPHELSVGDQQCVALARALAGDKRVLVCDEPTRDLGIDKAFQIDELIASLIRSGVLSAAVVCTQNLETAFRLGTRFLLLADGERLGSAEHCASADELRARPAFQRLLRLPAEPLFWDEHPGGKRAAASTQRFAL